MERTNTLGRWLHSSVFCMQPLHIRRATADPESHRCCETGGAVSTSTRGQQDRPGTPASGEVATVASVTDIIANISLR